MSAASLTIGCKVPCKKEGEYRIAEILSTATRNKQAQYYVHYQDFNKRLDEWVDISRFDLDHIEYPSSKENKSQKKEKRKSVLPTLTEDEILLDSSSQEKKDNEPFSKDKEIDRLRVSGSMTQNAHEISRVRNLSKIQMGPHEIEPWYFSPYPQEFVTSDKLYICEFCLSYFGGEKQYSRHRHKCNLQHPPGNEIYRKDNIAFFEIDGRRQKTWCRNLCLISKCFLDHKTLYYDVDPFLFYCMCTLDDTGYHLIGYFSKEKESREQYNVACILTLPQYQRHGYGRLLIAFSYELSKREQKHGSPEKPLSDLGLLGYRAFWTDTLVKVLLEAKKNSEEVTIDGLANATSMTAQDVLHTLQYNSLLSYTKRGHVVRLTDNVLEQYEKQVKKKRIQIVSESLVWTPPVFTVQFVN